MLGSRSVTALAAALLIAPVAGQSALAHDMDALYEAAKREGALNLYGGGPAAGYIARAKKFEQRFTGITVNVVGGFSNRLTTQIDAARKAGKPHADLALLQGFKLLSQYRLNDQFQRFMTDDTARIDALRLRFKGYTGEIKGPEIR